MKCLPLPACLALQAAAVLIIASTADGTRLMASEWPQILGPNRNAVAANESLTDRWPATGPRTLWQRNVGAGYAGLAVAEGRAVLFHRLGDQEIVEAMDAKSGQVLWKAEFLTRYSSTIASDDGPRCVPLIHDQKVFLFGASGNLHCVDLEGGKKLWSRPVYKEFDAQEGYFGAGSTPIVEDDKLLVNVGGRDGAGIVAFGLEDGATVWTATDEDASYSAPVAATVDGVRHAIFVTRLNCVSLDPQDGSVRFRFPFGMRGPTVNAATPVVIDDHLFLSASYGVGAVLARIEKNAAQQLWASDEVMSSQYSTSVYHDGVMYGIHGRQDLGVAELRCFDPLTGKVLWREEGFGTGNLILADDKLLIMKTDGSVMLIDPTKKGLRVLYQAQVLNSPVQALPALADGLLYVRDDKTLKCLDLRP